MVCILQGYTIWNHHGEEYDPPSFAFAHLPDNNENLPTPGVLRTATVDGHGRLDDMQGMLQAVFAMPANYESLSSMSEAELGDGQSDCGNMEHNVPEDVNHVQNDTARKQQDMYASFLKDPHTRLYSCQTFSKLSFLVNIYHLKCLHGWTQESVTNLLGVLSDAFPPEANLPKTYYEVKKIICGLGLNYVKNPCLP